MDRTKYTSCLIVLILAGLGGCSSEPSAETKKAATPADKIEGKAQLLMGETSTTDIALNSGGPSVYIWQGVRRYRLFFNKPFVVEGGKEYVVEGVNAQKVIDEMGDPDQGKDGYPLQTSCRRVVRTAWPGLALDMTEGHTSTLRARVKRYPARTVFLVTRITEKEGTAPKKAEEKEVPEVAVPADKQRALLIEGPTVHPAPLWEPKGGTVQCKVLIDAEGKIAELQTGQQLCEAVPWAQFRYKPTVQRGRPVNVTTEVEVKFDPRK